MKVFENEIGLVRLKFEETPSKKDMEDLKKRIEDYAPLHMMKDLTENVQEKVSRSDFSVVQSEINYLRKDLSKMCSKEEFLTRLNVFNSHINTKL